MLSVGQADVVAMRRRALGADDAGCSSSVEPIIAAIEVATP
jgi:hypothetical protein